MTYHQTKQNNTITYQDCRRLKKINQIYPKMKAKRMQKGTFLHFLTKKVTFFIFFFAVIYFMHIFAAKIRVRRLQTKRKVFSSAENSKLHNK